MEATWRPHEKHGDLTERSDSPHRPDGGGPQEVRTQGGGDA